MTTQVVIKFDKKVKDKAMKRAKRGGIPFDAVMNIAARAYAQRRFHIDGTQEEKFNAKTAREIRATMRDIKEGNEKNFSPAFTNIKDMRKWMEEKDKRRA